MSFIARGGIARSPGSALGKRTRPQSSPERATSTARELTSPKTSRLMPQPEATVGGTSASTSGLAHAGDWGLVALSQMQQTQQLLNEAIQLQAHRSALALRGLQELSQFDLVKFDTLPPAA